MGHQYNHIQHGRSNFFEAAKGKTAATRKILQSQKTFANYIADEEALAAQQPAPKAQPSSSTVRQSSEVAAIPILPLDTPEKIDAFLLESVVPPKPSEALISALVNAAPLSYNAARASPLSSGKPQRHFCEICGYWGRIKCLRCGGRVCGLSCKNVHDEERCNLQSFYA